MTVPAAASATAVVDVVVRLVRGRSGRRRVVETRRALCFECDGVSRPDAGIGDLHALLRSRGEPS